jgi:hypothetical protein
MAPPISPTVQPGDKRTARPSAADGTTTRSNGRNRERLAISMWPAHNPALAAALPRSSRMSTGGRQAIVELDDTVA